MKLELYDVINKTFGFDKHFLLRGIPNNSNIDICGLSEEDQEIYELVKNVMSICEKVKELDVEFMPAIIWEDKRSFGPQDVSDSDFDTLEKLEFDKLPITVRAKVADFLWVQKKKYKCATVALDAYEELYTKLFSKEDWINALQVMDRILNISALINDQFRKNKAYESLFHNLIEIDGADDGGLSILIIKRLINGKYGESQKIINILDKIIAKNSSNPSKVEQAFLCKCACYMLDKNESMAKQTYIELASYLKTFALSLDLSTFEAVSMAENLIVKAVNFYRNNGQTGDAEQLQKKLVDLQDKKPKLMYGFSKTFDSSKLYGFIDDSFEGLSFEEAIVRLTQYTIFHTYDSVKRAVLDDLKNNPISHMFKKGEINKDGQTILNLPPLELKDPESDQSLLDKHIHQKYRELEDIEGDLFLKRILNYIRSNYDFDETNLNFLVDNNLIIPSGRERIFKSAIYMGLKGQYYEALHILAPQLENLFRILAKELGALTVTLNSDGTSMEKVLSSVFDLPELVESYDESILFMFKGLLNEHTGANIRNEIGHGLLEEGRAYAGISVFFICSVIKLISFTSKPFFDIYFACDKLMNFSPPDASIVPEPIEG